MFLISSRKINFRTTSEPNVPDLRVLKHYQLIVRRIQNNSEYNLQHFAGSPCSFLIFNSYG